MMAGVAVAMFVGRSASIGSFVTVVAHRLPRGEGFVTGRSRCPACGRRSPRATTSRCVSWLALRGRCRNCGERISARYPLTELGLGALYAATYLILGGDDAGELVLGLILCTVLVAMTLTDLELRRDPERDRARGRDRRDRDRRDHRRVEPRTSARSPPRARAARCSWWSCSPTPAGWAWATSKLVAMMGLYLGRAIVPAILVGLLTGALVGRGADRPPRAGSAQAGGAVRPVPRARRA